MANKAEMAKQLVKQTLIQDQDLKMSLTKQIEEVKSAMIELAEYQVKVIKNQNILYQKMNSMTEKEVIQDLQPILTEIAQMKKQSQRLKNLFLTGYLMIQIPLLAILVAYLVVLALNK